MMMHGLAKPNLAPVISLLHRPVNMQDVTPLC